MIATLEGRMDKAEAWYAKHDKECAERFANIQNQTAPIPEIAQWFADKKKRSKQWHAFADKVLREGAQEALKLGVKILLVGAIAAAGGTTFMKVFGLP